MSSAVVAHGATGAGGRRQGLGNPVLGMLLFIVIKVFISSRSTFGVITRSSSLCLVLFTIVIISTLAFFRRSLDSRSNIFFFSFLFGFFIFFCLVLIFIIDQVIGL